MRITKILLCLLLSGAGLRVEAQDLARKQRSLEAAVKAAFRKKQVTPKEYYKLLEEQDVIRKTIERSKADDYLSPKEQNDIYGKLQRAEKRLRKYKTNREVY
ncbi:hypothetical protein LL912_22295 [Niabella sp. CC-SYL272]|uniref:hypothetical protein n=1 Tax=Niabella agricola TaxID=2891571 RepID=UPI001F2F4C4A|nr:hypothetical protein [Niabella agricola]MCF3111534.1 hypothetical protein [Niabella agricola]